MTRNPGPKHYRTLENQQLFIASHFYKGQSYVPNIESQLQASTIVEDLITLNVFNLSCSTGHAHSIWTKLFRDATVCTMPYTKHDYENKWLNYTGWILIYSISMNSSERWNLVRCVTCNSLWAIVAYHGCLFISFVSNANNITSHQRTYL